MKLLLAAFLCHYLGQACPSGYMNYSGAVPVSEHFGSAVTRPTIDDCGGDCDSHEDCLSFQYSDSSQLCHLSVLWLPDLQSSTSDFQFCSKDSYLGYAAVNLMASNESFRINASGAVTPLGAVPVGQTQVFRGPVSVLSQRNDGLVAEWVNVVLRGREFSWQVMNSGLHQFTVFATEDANVTVTFYGMMTYTSNVLAGSALLLASVGARQVDVSSTGDILLASDSAPVPPAAETIFGQCSTVCHISVFGGDEQVQLTRSCTNGTTETVAPGRYWQEGPNYTGETCVWSAPGGYKISGHADEDGSGLEGSSFQALEHFQLVTPLSGAMDFASFVSDQSTLCTHNTDGSTFVLTGSSGVYHARVSTPPASSVITCDAPVAVVARLRDCIFQVPCSNEVLNLVTAVAFTTTSTTTTTSSTTTSSNTTTATTTSSTSGTNTTSTLTTSSLTATTSSNTSTATNTTSTMTSTATATTITATTATATTSTSSNSSTTSTASNTTTVSSTATATATNSTTTASGTVTTATFTPSSNASANVTAAATNSTTTTSGTVATTTCTPSSNASANVTAAVSTSTTASSTATSSTSTTASSTATFSTTASSTATSSTSSTSTVSITTVTASTATTATTTASTASTATNSTATANASTANSSMLSTSTWTSSTTSSTTSPTSTTITTSTTTSLLAPSELVKELEEVESSLLADVLASNGSSSVAVVLDGYTVVGFVLNSSAVAPGRENLTVLVPGVEAQVTVPASAFDELGVDGLVLLVSYIDPSNASLPLSDSAGEKGEVVAAVNVNLFTLSGVRVDVDGLVRPVELILPTAYNSSTQCAFWDELNLRWSSSGVDSGPSPEGLVLCRAYHLTLFAAILRGFTNTFKCSKATLLTAEGLAELASSGWYTTPAALAFWALLLVFAVLMLRAAAKDCSRAGIWTDEHFLIEMNTSVVVQRSTTAVSTAASGCLLSCLFSCKESSALRDALDDIVSNWFGSFGEWRSFIEGLCEGLELGSCFSCNVFYFTMSTMLAHAARRQAAASLGISMDWAMFVLEDEDANDLLVTRHVKTKVDRANSIETEDNPSSAVTDGTREQSSMQGDDALKPSPSRRSMEQMASLHELLGKGLEAHLHRSARWVSLPCTVWRLFVYGSPFGSAMVHCIFYSSSLRVMFFMVDILGALVLAALFFQSSGGFVSKRSRSFGCDTSESTDIGESLGRLLAIGVSSMVIAGIPSMVLQSLPTRAVKKVEFRGCPAWERQLKVWRIQDRIVWTLSFLYVGFCIFFITLFFANVVPEEQTSWTVSATIAIAQDAIIIPLSVALVIPLLGLTCLSLVSCMTHVRKQELVSERHVELNRTHANLTLPLVYI